MKKYTPPEIKEKKVVVNNFLTRNPFTDPFADFSSYFQIGSVYSQTMTPRPPNTGTAGLKDERVVGVIRGEHGMSKDF